MKSPSRLENVRPPLPASSVEAEAADGRSAARIAGSRGSEFEPTPWCIRLTPGRVAGRCGRIGRPLGKSREMTRETTLEPRLESTSAAGVDPRVSFTVGRIRNDSSTWLLICSCVEITNRPSVASASTGSGSFRRPLARLAGATHLGLTCPRLRPLLILMGSPYMRRRGSRSGLPARIGPVSDVDERTKVKLLPRGRGVKTRTIFGRAVKIGRCSRC